VAKKAPVRLIWQSIFMIIPVFDLYAAYRVEKLRKYLLFIVISLTASMIVLLILFPDLSEYSDSEFILFGRNVDTDAGFEWGMELVAIGISIILIRKWSKKWNEQFSENSEYEALDNTS